MGDDSKNKEEAAVVHTYALAKYSEMSEDLRGEAMELVVTACEKFAGFNEAAARMIKETMDKKFGPNWQVVVGEGFGFEVSYQLQNILYMFLSGNLACIMWKIN